jgi:hypothetical protein
LRGLERLCDAIIGRKPFARATHEIEVSPLRFWRV